MKTPKNPTKLQYTVSLDRFTARDLQHLSKSLGWSYSDVVAAGITVLLLTNSKQP